jgi:hypothetical protein
VLSVYLYDMLLSTGIILSLQVAVFVISAFVSLASYLICPDLLACFFHLQKPRRAM